MNLENKIFTHPNKKDTRKNLRRNMLRAEFILWSEIKNRAINGAKFRRQHSVGSYILDFYCPKHLPAIEIDGDSHFDDKQKIYDLNRQKYIESFGIKVLRFTNHDIYYNLGNVLKIIKDNTNLPSPLLYEEGKVTVPPLSHSLFERARKTKARRG